ncbi:MAG: tetratricopeptide repeat protein [Chloroflexi bacterium]|nr:tetratricopeptide repeat protein [Chloroflexota bacterium]
MLTISWHFAPITIKCGGTQYGKGRIYYELGNYEDAVQELTKSIDYKTTEGEIIRFTNQKLLLQATYYRALAHLELGIVEEAITDFETFLQNENGLYPNLATKASVELGNLLEN